MEVNRIRELTGRFLSMMYRMRLLNKKGHTIEELPPAEFFMIMAIGKHTEKDKNEKLPGITVSQLVDETGTTVSAGSKLLRSVEQKGLIERLGSESDRRVTYIRLSEKGKRMLEKQVKARDAMMEGIVRKMGEENMEILLTQMENLYKILKEEMEEMEKND